MNRKKEVQKYWGKKIRGLKRKEWPLGKPDRSGVNWGVIDSIKQLKDKET